MTALPPHGSQRQRSCRLIQSRGGGPAALRALALGVDSVDRDLPFVRDVAVAGRARVDAVEDQPGRVVPAVAVRAARVAAIRRRGAHQGVMAGSAGNSGGGAGGTVVNLIVDGMALQSPPPGRRLTVRGTAVLSGVMVTTVSGKMMTLFELMISASALKSEHRYRPLLAGSVGHGPDAVRSRKRAMYPRHLARLRALRALMP
jgi:hypothetical protein